MNPTEEYIKQHKKIFSLKKVICRSEKKIRVTGWSFFGLFHYHIRSIIRAIAAYPKELYFFREFFKKTWILKNSALEYRALVIGNGPSQGYLTLAQLDFFQKSGGQTFCVNYWHKNHDLSDHVPNWIIVSDPDTFKSSDAINFIHYLKKNPSIKLLIPTFMLPVVRAIDLVNEINCFIDTELSVWKNINPMLPRGYLSMSLYKALAWAVYMGFSKIGVIGMDNTYPRNIYNDLNNKLCALESHAGVDDYLADHSELYQNVAARLDELVKIFHHLNFFPIDRIFNLDPFSLTDAFVKLRLDSFIQDNQ